MKLVAFTSVNAAYLPKARVLASTLKRFHPEIEFHVLLAEPRGPQGIAVDDPFDRVVDLSDVELEHDRPWLFSHSVVEMCTALKGRYLQRLLADGDVGAALYFDPDIAILGSLARVIEALQQGSVVLVPHQLGPERDLETIIDNEVCAMLHGVYNLGFLAVRNDATGRALAEWWATRLASFCHIDYERGLFTDQRWFDLAPALFDGVVLLRSPGHDVATWNLSQHHLEGTAPFDVRVDGEPLSFFHFSGFDGGAQLIMAMKYARQMPVVFALRNWYIRACAAAGQAQPSGRRWRFDYFADGAEITTAHRRLYRAEPRLRTLFPDPFDTADPARSYRHWYAASARGAVSSLR